MKIFSSLSKQTTGKETIFTVANDQQRNREDLSIEFVNKNVEIDGIIYKVKKVDFPVSKSIIGKGEHIKLITQD